MINEKENTINEVSNEKTLENNSEKRRIKLPSVKMPRKIFLIVLLIAVTGSFAYLAKNYLIAATVNGEPITRFSVIRDLERASGGKALDGLVSMALIRQEAKRQNIVVTQDEINAEISKVEELLKSQNQTIDEVLQLRKMTRNDMIDQIVLQKQLEKMLLGNISVEENEINEFITANEKYMPENAIGDEIVRQQVKEQIQQEKFAQEYNNWLAELKNKSEINYFINY